MFYNKIITFSFIIWFIYSQKLVIFLFNVLITCIVYKYKHNAILLINIYTFYLKINKYVYFVKITCLIKSINVIEFNLILFK